MKKKDIVNAAKEGFPDRILMVNSIFKAINKALINKEKVTIYNFGKFYVSKSKVRKVYDFQRGETVTHKGHLNIKFRASPAVRKMLNSVGTP